MIFSNSVAKKVTDLDITDLINFKLVHSMSLFTNVAIEVALEYINKNFALIEPQDIPKNYIINVIKFIFETSASRNQKNRPIKE